MTREEWEREKPIEGQPISIDMKWFYEYYLENIGKSSLDIRLSIDTFIETFSMFLVQLDSEQRFIPMTEGAPRFFRNGKAWYISKESIIHKVIEYFNNKKDWHGVGT